MPPKPRLFAPVEALVVATMVLAIASGTSAAPKFKVLHAFGAGKDGAGLYSGVALDRQGDLYGATSGGGAYGYGTVFQLAPHPAAGGLKPYSTTLRITTRMETTSMAA